MATSIRDLLYHAEAALTDASIDEPGLEASVLLAHVLRKSRTWLFAHPEAAPVADVRQRFEALIADRVAGEPVAYLTGEREFWSLPLRVSRNTLVPRADTELVTERALAVLPKREAHVADLGTGSGAIAASLAWERPGWQIVATDASPPALETARENFNHLGLSRVETRLGDWYRPLHGERFDLVVSNPPYIRDGDPHLGCGDPRHEPRMALVSGHDGLDALRRIIGEAHRHLVAAGWLIVEHGWDQGEAVRALFQAARFSLIRTHHDLTGHERVTEGRLTRR